MITHLFVAAGRRRRGGRLQTWENPLCPSAASVASLALDTRVEMRTGQFLKSIP